jgi:hypothetical protein
LILRTSIDEGDYGYARVVPERALPEDGLKVVALFSDRGDDYTAFLLDRV